MKQDLKSTYPNLVKTLKKKNYKVVQGSDRGGIGNLYFLQNKKSDPYILKIGPKRDMENQYRAMDELRQENLLSHLELKEYLSDVSENKSGFIMSRLDNYMDLKKYMKLLQEKKIKMNPYNYVFLENSLTRNLNELHDNGYFHSDIKEANIMVSFDVPLDFSKIPDELWECIHIENSVFIDYGFTKKLKEINTFGGWTTKRNLNMKTLLGEKRAIPSKKSMEKFRLKNRTTGFSSETIKQNERDALKAIFDRMKMLVHKPSLNSFLRNNDYRMIGMEEKSSKVKEKLKEKEISSKVKEKLKEKQKSSKVKEKLKEKPKLKEKSNKVKEKPKLKEKSNKVKEKQKSNEQYQSQKSSSDSIIINFISQSSDKKKKSDKKKQISQYGPTSL